MSLSYVVLTPGLTGRDGIARASRLIVSALRLPAATASEHVRALAMNDPPGMPFPNDHTGAIHLAGAGGRKSRFVVSALLAVLGRARPPEVLCLHLHMSPLAWMVAGSRSRLTAFLWGIEAWRPLERMERWALSRADILIAISEHTARRFCEANPAFASRPIRICHLGVAGRPATAAPLAQANERPWSAPFALIVGRMAADERYKGHDLLIDIWPRIVVDLPEARLVVAGDGDDRGRLERRAAVLGKRVTFLGHVSDLALEALYRDCAFFVMPSRNEGFGLVFVEAMRAGKACIGSVGAAAEVIEDGVTGFVVDPDEPGQVLQAMLRLFRESETRERMGQAGALRMRQHFTEEHFRCRFRAILGLGAEPA
jgi:phosphatidylinositol alpha-1,6-mannosyltransferase